jgi:surface antigen
MGAIRIPCVVSLALAGAVSLGAGGCGISFPIASLMPDNSPKATSAVKPISPLSSELGAEDWRRAKSALAVALDPQGTGATVSWDNPDTALKGSFTAIGNPFVQNDEICRHFRATIVGQTETTTRQGTACRLSGGEWTLKAVRPLAKA